MPHEERELVSDACVESTIAIADAREDRLGANAPPASAGSVLGYSPSAAIPRDRARPRAVEVSVPAAPALPTAEELVGPARPTVRSFPLSPRRRASRRPRRASWMRTSLFAAVKLGLLVFIAYGLMFNFSVVRGSSMSPGIHDGDRILVNHLSYVFQDVHRGDIVVLQYPLDPNLDYIKRVIGLPGDDIRIDDGRVFVNDVRLEEPYIAPEDSHSRLIAHVEPEHFFVMGDNRPHSSDSREFGLVPRENLRGKVDVRVWPPSRVGTLH